MSTTITAGVLRAYPRPVADVLRSAINDHGVTWRDLDGTHIRLYSGSRDIPPMKVAASRPAEHTLRRLIPWLGKHVSTWSEDEVTATAVRVLADAVNTTRHDDDADDAPDPDPTPQPPAATWRPHVRADGKRSTVETDGERFRCPVCKETFPTAPGAGVHRANAHGDGGTAAKAAHTRAQNRAHAQAALAALADYIGVPVAAPEVERLRKKVDTLTKERDDLKAKLDLMRDAFNA